MEGMRVVLFLAALELPSVHGWTASSMTLYGAQISDIRQQQHGNYTGGLHQALGYLWTLPEETTNSRGLGGGIAWAWDPALCDSLLPRFRESLLFVNLVECSDLQAAMHRAMASWSANHQYISFVDMTDECLKYHGTVDKDGCTLGGARPVIELWVKQRELDQNENDEEGSYGAIEAASARPAVVPAAAGSFRYTNGETSSIQVIETVGGTIEFGTTGLCW